MRLLCTGTVLQLCGGNARFCGALHRVRLCPVMSCLAQTELLVPYGCKVVRPQTSKDDHKAANKCDILQQLPATFGLSVQLTLNRLCLCRSDQSVPRPVLYVHAGRSWPHGQDGLIDSMGVNAGCVSGCTLLIELKQPPPKPLHEHHDECALCLPVACEEAPRRSSHILRNYDSAEHHGQPRSLAMTSRTAVKYVCLALLLVPLWSTIAQEVCNGDLCLSQHSFKMLLSSFGGGGLSTVYCTPP